MSLLNVALQSSALLVAVDPGKVSNRIWLSDGAGMLAEPVSMPVSREGIAAWNGWWSSTAPRVRRWCSPIEATGSLHRAWSAEFERRYPGTVRLFAPSETKAGRTQLGSGRFKTDDRDCAALTYLARQGGGRPGRGEVEIEELRAMVRHRHG